MLIKVDDADKRYAQLLKKGIETSRLYGEALHQIFPDDIKNASDPIQLITELSGYLYPEVISEERK